MVRSLGYEHGLGDRFRRTDRLAKAEGPEDGGAAGWVLPRGVPRPAAVSHLIDPVGTVLTSPERRRRGFAGSAPRESEAGAILSVGRESPLYNAGFVGSTVVRSTPSLLRGAA